MRLPCLPFFRREPGGSGGARPYHPMQPALEGQGPDIAVLVELPEAGNARMVGTLLGDPSQEVTIGAEAEVVFKPHDAATPPCTLVQWRMVG